MNLKDKELIKGIILSDIKPITNPDFTLATIEKVKGLEKEHSFNFIKSADLTLIFPILIFSILIIFLSIIKVFNLWIDLEKIIRTASSIEIISHLLLHPITISLMISFSVLFLLDSYLSKHNTKFSKPNRRYKSLGCP